MVKLLALTKDPLEMNGPELLSYLAALDANARNYIRDFQEQREAAEATGNRRKVRRLNARIAEYESYLQHHAGLRDRVRQDFAGELPNGTAPGAP